MRSGRAMPMVVTAAAVIASTLFAAHAGSLAGSEGEVKRKPYFPASAVGGCKGGYQQYTAARGHSAYASTPSGWGNEHYICGWSLNTGSKAKAEAAALKNCNSGLKKYKMGVTSPCELVASK